MFISKSVKKLNKDVLNDVLKDKVPVFMWATGKTKVYVTDSFFLRIVTADEWFIKKMDGRRDFSVDGMERILIKADDGASHALPTGGYRKNGKDDLMELLNDAGETTYINTKYLKYFEDEGELKFRYRGKSTAVVVSNGEDRTLGVILPVRV